MTSKKGIIALDIDGTITHTLHDISPDVVQYLHTLSQEGWQIVFVTGRIFSFAYTIVRHFSFPYYLAVQNGADILEMPSQKLVHRSYLTGNEIALLEQVYIGQKEDFIVYAGYDVGDFCYFRPHKCTKPFLQYLGHMQILSKEPWVAVEDFDKDAKSLFSLVKCLGSQEEMQAVHAKIAKIPVLHATLIRDVLTESPYFLNLVTHHKATKAHALEYIIEKEKIEGPSIAAGDDRNDLAMIQRADIGIAMQNAPKEVLDVADIVAPLAKDLGIITALQEAVKRAMR